MSTQTTARPFAELIARCEALGTIIFNGTSAAISDCGRYRYMLTRTWVATSPSILTFVMLNPSTADHRADDPTIRSCVRLATANSFDGIRILNLFAFRSSSPEKLFKAKLPIGERNDHFLQQLTPQDTVVAGWGNHKAARFRADAVHAMLRSQGVDLQCFERCDNGAPKHPLYISSQAEMTRWRGYGQ